MHHPIYLWFSSTRRSSIRLAHIVKTRCWVKNGGNFAALKCMSSVGKQMQVRLDPFLTADRQEIISAILFIFLVPKYSAPSSLNSFVLALAKMLIPQERAVLPHLISLKLSTHQKSSRYTLPGILQSVISHTISKTTNSSKAK